jgi:dolichol-phosphate mannosyltransferase
MISIVIPAKNEALSLPGLLDDIEAAMAGREFEVIVVNDGSTDATSDVLAAEKKKRSWPVRQVRHAKSCGQSLALQSGFLVAKGELIATLDGDGQNDPAYLPEMIDKLRDAGADFGLAAGQRVKRKHTFLKNLASRFANWLRGALLKDDTRDSGCGIKVIRADVMRRVPFFNGTHRFLPALVKYEGYRTLHVQVVDRQRQHGTSHYGILDRGLRGVLDLLGVMWLAKRRKNVPRVEEITDV